MGTVMKTVCDRWNEWDSTVTINPPPSVYYKASSCISPLCKCFPLLLVLSHTNRCNISRRQVEAQTQGHQPGDPVLYFPPTWWAVLFFSCFWTFTFTDCFDLTINDYWGTVSKISWFGLQNMHLLAEKWWAVMHYRVTIEYALCINKPHQWIWQNQCLVDQSGII